jgi:hypothetical protein
MARFARQAVLHRRHQIRIADQHLARTVFQRLFEQRLAGLAPCRCAEHEEAFGVGIDQCIILEKTGAFGQFLAAELRLGRHAPFELRVGF